MWHAGHAGPKFGVQEVNAAKHPNENSPPVRRGGAATFYQPRRGGSQTERRGLESSGLGTTPIVGLS